MRRRIPTAGIVGLAASAVAIVLWTTEQLTGQLAFERLTIPFKLLLLAAPLFFASDLSSFLHGRPRLAIALGMALVAVTLGAMLAYIPWRQPFTEHFSNGVYRWYYDGMPERHGGYYGDFSEWQSDWSHHVPHMIEAGIVLLYYGAILTACTRWRLHRVSGAAVAVLGYILVMVLPVLTGLIVWDYDTFLKGIAFDSISMDLFPHYVWHAGDYSVFLYSFLLIFFGVSVGFFYVKGRNAGSQVRRSANS